MIIWKLEFIKPYCTRFMNYDLIDEKLKKIKQELREESKYKYPSPNSLERSATSLMGLMKKIQSEEEERIHWIYSLNLELEIFKADLVGELHHDYKKRNVRYRNKWNNEERKIREFISEITTNIKETE
jgi:hypothetical protein